MRGFCSLPPLMLLANVEERLLCFALPSDAFATLLIEPVTNSGSPSWGEQQDGTILPQVGKPWERPVNVKYQILVNFPYTDLKEERDQVTKAIREMGHIPGGTEMFT